MGGCKRDMKKGQVFPAGTGSSPALLRSWSWKSENTKAARICREKYQRRESSRELRRVTLESSAKQFQPMCEETTPGL